MLTPNETLILLVLAIAGSIAASKTKTPQDTGFLKIQTYRFPTNRLCTEIDWTQGGDHLENNKCKDFGQTPYHRISWLGERKSDRVASKDICHVTTYNGSHCTGHGWKYNYVYLYDYCVTTYEQVAMYSVGVTCGDSPMTNIPFQPNPLLTTEVVRGNGSSDDVHNEWKYAQRVGAEERPPPMRWVGDEWEEAVPPHGSCER